MPKLIRSFSTTPPGEIRTYSGNSVPEGFLLCDGSAISRTTYASLYNAIGTTWGYGNNSTTFNLPDLRGRFLRGRDGGIGRDPDRGSRTACNTGGNSGDNVGSVQSSTFYSHNHGSTNHSHSASSPGTHYHNAPNSNGVPAGLEVTWNPVGGIDFIRAAPVSTSAGNLWVGNSGAIASASGGNETRPINAYVHYMIKY